MPPGADLRKVLADAADRRATIDRGCASGTAQAGELAEQTGRHTFKTKAEETEANNRAIAEALFDLIEEEEAQKMRGTFSTPMPTGGLTWSKEHGLAATGSDETAVQAPDDEDEQMKWALQESLREAGSRKRPLPTDREDIQVITKANLPPKPSNNTIIRKDTPLIDLTGDDDLAVSAKKPATHPPPNSGHWACEVCTCINPQQYLACDACGVERLVFNVPATPSSGTPTTLGRSNTLRPMQAREIRKEAQKESAGWNCRECGTFVEHMWWCCTLCGLMKDRS